MRPNYAMDPPPTAIRVGGEDYPCATDYRVWIEALELMRALHAHPAGAEDVAKLADELTRLETLVFGRVIDADPLEALEAVAEFSRGYPCAPAKGSAGTGRPTYSFEYDLNEIIIAIRNQSGIDLSWRRKEPFHWWEFLLEFRTLCGEHYILRLMEARGYTGKDPEMRRRRDAVALPEEYTPEERAEYDEFSAQFDAPGEAREE